MAKVNRGWNPSKWLHDVADNTSDPLKKAKYHNTASKWPTWRDDDAMLLNSEEGGVAPRKNPEKTARRTKVTVDQLLNRRTRKTR